MFPTFTIGAMWQRLLAVPRSTGLWALGDQGVVSVGTFLVTLVLGRRLPAAEFGVFGVLLGILVTANTAHASLIGIPLMVLTGRRTDARSLPPAALAWTLVSAAVFTAVLTVALLVLGRPGLLPWAECALLGSQLQETLRRSLIGRLQFRRATSGDGLSYLGQAVGVTILAATGNLTVASALAVMALTSLAAAAVQAAQVRPRFAQGALGRDAVEPFWQLGKSLLLVNGIGALTIQAILWLLGAVHGISAVGSFQALLTVMGFTNPLMLAVNSVVTTRIAHTDENDPAVRRRMEVSVARRYGLLFGLPLVAYCAVLLATPEVALRLFFGSSSPYRALAGELRVFVFFSMTQYLYFVLAGVLNARQDTRSLLRAAVASALTVPLLGVPLTVGASVGGAAVATVVTAGTRALVAARHVVPRRPS
ncbi:MAG: hypothetical protein M3137_11770 [Actinomycetota bacterium]|nr:hypothetical protein [Actinomycetota bacterium]